MSITPITKSKSTPMPSVRLSKEVSNNKFDNPIIQVNNISLIDKDIVDIAMLEDFMEINKHFFPGGTVILDLHGTYYLIGTDIVYTCRANGKKPNM